MSLYSGTAAHGRLIAFALVLLAATGPARAAAAVCSSDGKAPPAVLVERFLPDDCTACWRRTPPAPDRAAFSVDWIVPGDHPDAPMAAAARPEAAQRLATLGYTSDTAAPQFWKWRHAVVGAHTGRLRVAHGPAVNDYVGVSIEWTPGAAGARPLDAWLLLVEELPAGTEGSPVVRRLVRGALAVEGIAAGPRGWAERRSMHRPDGTDPSRLRLIGWVADQRGRVMAAAADECSR